MRSASFIVLVLLTLLLGLESPVFATSELDKQLIEATKNKNFALPFESLLAQGADVNASDADLMTVLHWAAWSGHTPNVVKLLEKGAALQARNRNGWTALHLAAKNGHASTVEALLERGADVYSIDDQTETAIQEAKVKGYNEIAEMLSNPTEIRLIRARFALKQISETQVVGGENEQRGDATSSSNLYCSQENSRQTLIEKRSDINAKYRRNWTPLHLAAKTGDAEQVEKLLGRGADVHARDNNGWTPLHMAAMNGHTAVIERLIAANTDVNVEDEFENTPLHFAASNLHCEAVRLLIASGAHEDLVSKFNKSALELAYDQRNNSRHPNFKNYDKIVQILENPDSYRTLELRTFGKKQKDAKKLWPKLVSILFQR
jgi:cytohesin